MSNYWRFRCHDCADESPSLNNGERELAKLLEHRATFEALSDLEMEMASLYVRIEVWGDSTALPAFFGQHKGHRITVRSEYGYDLGDCAEHTSEGFCRLPKGHEGGHSPIPPG